jgi:hypothetical protein
MSQRHLKISYLDGTKLPTDGGSEQIITSGNSVREIMENNRITVDDLPCTSRDGTYKIEEA